MLKTLIFTSIICAALAQKDYTTPVPILKQINRHNEDGSYSYGYEGADGSFKIETKYANGEVYGKYGYVDDAGKVREVEYGASKRGFEPQGSDINVPPPTVNNNQNTVPLGPNEQDDGQYREDPSVYYKSSKYNKAPSKLAGNPQHRFVNNVTPNKAISLKSQYKQPKSFPAPQYEEQYQQEQYEEPAPRQYKPQRQQYQPQPQQYQPQPQYQPQQQYRPQYQPQQQQQQHQQPYYQPQSNYYSPSNPNIFHGHPAEHIDINTGSYSLNYVG